ncbi:MAG TPA: hypothetical protein PK185_06600 [Cyclobacteriaceae bacterium]|nr:hypothetical protein [Cyclobacteriaceae bacterium]
MKQSILFCLFFLFCHSVSFGQPADYSKDVATKESIIHALYEVISGPPEQQRDWMRFRNLFLPESRLIPTGKNKQNEFTIRAISPEAYIQMFTTNIKSGFFEKELHQEVEEYGTIAHVFSTYETRESINGAVSNRGINSIQLYNDGNRYYVVNIFWCAESMGFTLPSKYLN